MDIKLKDNDLTTLPGVGAATKVKLEEIGISTITDIILFLPTYLIDKSTTHDPKNVRDKQRCIFIGIIKSIFITKKYKQSMILKLKVDDTDIQIRFIHKIFMFSNLKSGLRIRVTGTVYLKSSILNMIHPEVEIINDENDIEKIIPFYDTKKKVTQGKIRKLIKFLVNYLANKKNEDVFFDDQLSKLNLPNYLDALKSCHFPSSKTTYEETFKQFIQGRKRFIFEELLTHRITINTDLDNAMTKKGYKLDFRFSDIQQMINKLNFSLTKSQIDVLRELELDFTSGIVSRRLIQGDVGCGKTIVAALAAYMCHLSNLQSAFLVPTEILANQHYNNLSTLFDATDINIKLIVSRLSQSKKNEIYEQLISGDINLIIGTHSLLSEKVKFKNLGLSIIDEQHKFGVDQRSSLSKKSKKLLQPHQILLSATPIPRSLSLVLYEGLNYSKITDMPEGRKSVVTKLITKNDRATLFDIAKETIQSGQQVFWVCPAIDNTVTNTSDIYGVYDELINNFEAKRIAILHGQAEKNENEKNMKNFHNHDSDILLCTTMIEVGVDVQNASTIIIEDADRFGLSQLHQLRGRVGRGNQQGYCYLVYDKSCSDKSIKRIESLVNSSDGFSVAETDLKLRGAGDYFGQRQSGLHNNFKLLNYEEVLDNFSEISKINDVYLELTDSQKKILLSRWASCENKGIDL